MSDSVIAGVARNPGKPFYEEGFVQNDKPSKPVRVILNEVKNLYKSDPWSIVLSRCSELQIQELISRKFKEELAVMEREFPLKNMSHPGNRNDSHF